MAAPAPAATYYVDGARGSEDNDGIAAPFKTIRQALRVLRTSDTLVLTPRDEPYRESLPLRVGGTATAPLTIEGNGAVLSGADPAPTKGWTEQGGVYSVPQDTEVRFLFGDEVCYAKGQSATGLEAEQWFWQEGALHFRPAEGKAPADYGLEMSVRISGVLTNGAGQIIVRDLTCQHFFNDGFNIHGGSAPMWFERIRGNWNGDEGFSAHENCECHVRDAEFSHNQCHGIADIDLARTHYSGITVRDNVLKNIFFIGRLHSVIDSEVSGSPENITLAASTPASIPRIEGHPLAGSSANFRNVVVRSGPNELGAHLRTGSEAVFEHCLLEGGRVALTVDAGARCHVMNSILRGEELEVQAAGEYAADHNLYWPGRLEVAGTRYDPDEFAAYREATGNDASSWLAEAKFVGDSLWPSRASRAVGNAFNAAYGGADIGPSPRGERPPEDPSVLPIGATLLESERIRFAYDFEASNPWSRVYPAPDKTPEGEPIEAASELSTEQAHSGTHSARLTWSLPAHPDRSWLVKLFSVKMPYHRPVAAMSFSLYGDGSGLTFRPRVRDRSGEGFSMGPPTTIDWQGWREVAWDLEETPPEIMGGDGNRLQNSPPLEVVLDITVPPSPGPHAHTLYFDDLTVDLALP